MRIAEKALITSTHIQNKSTFIFDPVKKEQSSKHINNKFLTACNFKLK